MISLFLKSKYRDLFAMFTSLVNWVDDEFKMVSYALPQLGKQLQQLGHMSNSSRAIRSCYRRITDHFRHRNGKSHKSFFGLCSRLPPLVRDPRSAILEGGIGSANGPYKPP